MDFSSILITVAIFVTPHVGGNVVQDCGCPVDFERHGDQCYKVMGVQASWPEAKVYCQIIGGDLVQITSASVQTIIAGLVQKHNGIVANEHYWVDGSDMLETRAWRWMGTNGNSIPFSYTNWQPGEPNNIKEICVDVRWETSSRWHDEECANRQSFICQGSSTMSD